MDKFCPLYPKDIIQQIELFEPVKEGEMTYRTFVEDDNKYPSHLKLWRTVENKVWLEVGPEDSEDSMMTQGLVLSYEDAMELLNELQAIVNQMKMEVQTFKKYLKNDKRERPIN